MGKKPVETESFAPVGLSSLFVVLGQGLFDRHVAELAGFKHFAAEFALHVLGVFITAHHPHTRVLAGFCHGKSGQLQAGFSCWMAMEHIREVTLYATIVNGGPWLVKMPSVKISLPSIYRISFYDSYFINDAIHTWRSYYLIYLTTPDHSLL